MTSCSTVIHGALTTAMRSINAADRAADDDAKECARCIKRALDELEGALRTAERMREGAK